MTAHAWRVYGEGDATGYDVPGLPEIMDQTYEQNRLFSETDLPWAVPTAPVSVRDLKAIDFERYCPGAPANQSS